MKIERVLGGLLAGVGSVVLVAGFGPLVTGARWVVAHADVVLLGAALLALWAATPDGARRLSLLLAGAAAVVAVAQRDVEPSLALGGSLIALGALVSSFRLDDAFRTDIDPVHRYRRWIYWRRIAAKPESFLPRQLRISAVATRMEVDLSAAQPGQWNFLELVLTCWFAKVTIAVPPPWPVVAGRVFATRRVKFDGALDTAQLFMDLGHEEQQADLAAIVDRRLAEHSESGGVGVVVHVAGGFSRICLVGR